MNTTTRNKPGVGIGVIIENSAGEILIGKRLGSHAEKYSIPGGKLELGESFEHGAVREIKEEVGLTLEDVKVMGVTNNLETFREEGVHNISIVMVAKKFVGTPRIMEPEKCTELLWCDPHELPEPHFDASRLAVECYLNGSVYQGMFE